MHSVQVAEQQQQQQQRGGASNPRPSLAAGCVRAFQGVSPSLVADLCAAAGVSPSDPPAALSDGQWAALHAGWLSWLERVQSGETPSPLPHSCWLQVLRDERVAERDPNPDVSALPVAHCAVIGSCAGALLHTPLELLKQVCLLQ